MSGEGGFCQSRVAITTRMRRGTITCPVCNDVAGIRDSDQETALVKALWCACTNVDCGLTFKAQISFVYMLSPSAIERPDLNLPGPPPGYARRVYAAGPPGLPPDPNQLAMFEDEDTPGAAHRSEAA
jgi:hypothetical protein